MPRERKPDEWSVDQKNHRKCFASVMKYASRMMKTFVKPIWNKAATETLSGFNLFVKANKPAFNANGIVADPGLLRFSEGSLPLPGNLMVTKSFEQSNVITVCWKNQITNPTLKHNQLMAVFYRIDELVEPFLKVFMRKDEQAQIVLPENMGNEIWLYLFFRSVDQSAYSNDQAFKIEY